MKVKKRGRVVECRRQKERRMGRGREKGKPGARRGDRQEKNGRRKEREEWRRGSRGGRLCERREGRGQSIERGCLQTAEPSPFLF